MKLSLKRKAKELASSLLTTLVICSILSMFVMYYLSLIDQQSYLNARSQVWNMAMAVTEAGVEDGLQQLNTAFPDMNTDGWAYDGSTYYYRSNTLPDGSSYVSYIYITNWSLPVVMARAYVQSIPQYGMASPESFFATIGASTGPQTINRAVLVTTKRNSPFQVAIVARKNIDLNGKGISTDSFDSTDPTKSVNGQYVGTFYSGNRGDVATDMGVIDSISGGNANIYGHAHTGPGSPTTAAQIGSQGSIGPHGTSAGTIASGWWLPDSNFTFPTTSYPNTASYLNPTNGVVVITTNALSLGTSVTYTYPSMPPTGGASTNYVASTTSTVYPIPTPPLVSTNYYNDVSTFPSPTPSPMTTNTTYIVNSGTAPALGTYVGTIAITNWNNGKYGTWYSYWEITGYTYQTYTYPTGYQFTPYQTNLVYLTNSYNNILWGTTSLDTTNYYVSSSLSGSTIVIGENVVLAVSGGLNMNGNDQLLLTKAGEVVSTSIIYPDAAITLYSGGTSGQIGGNGVVNETGYAGNFILYAAPTVTSFNFVGNGTFSGVLVAPTADISLSGGGGNPQDFIGSIIGNSVTMNGNFKFHYDEALAGGNKKGRFIIMSWNEIK